MVVYKVRSRRRSRQEETDAGVGVKKDWLEDAVGRGVARSGQLEVG